MTQAMSELGGHLELKRPDCVLGWNVAFGELNGAFDGLNRRSRPTVPKRGPPIAPKGDKIAQPVVAAMTTGLRFGLHEAEPGRLTLNESVPPWVRAELTGMGYRLDFRDRTSGPLQAIYFDRTHGTMWGGASHHGEDYGVAW